MDNKKFKPSLIKKGIIASALGLSLVMGTSAVVPVEPTKVEAAKDRKKPKIKFKGSKKLTAEEGEKVTIPATTYSDNKTKKKKLKVGVTVKKGKKSYKTIAKKIQKATLKSKPVAVTFEDDGTYKITTTVTDLAKNKATAVRYVTVSDAEIIEEEKVVTKEDPATEEKTTEEQKRTVTTEATTETKTTETPKTEAPTEEVTTELPKTEEPKEEKEYTVYDYNVSHSKDKEIIDMLGEDPSSDNIKINIENDFDVLVFDRNCELLKNNEYLKYLGKITATDENGNDISDRIIIYDLDLESAINNIEYSKLIYIYVSKENGEALVKSFWIDFSDNPYLKTDGYEKLSNSPLVYGERRIVFSSNVTKANKKTLVLS